MRVYQIDNQKPYPDTEVAYIPRPCQHCEGSHGHHTPCVSVCPATATDHDPETGIVSQIPTRCIGCRYCVAACPYHARYFNWFDVPWPDGMDKPLSPYVSPRMRGVVEKCTFCIQRYQAARNLCYAEEREMEEADYQTACTQACPAGAITFGDLNNEDHKVHELSQSENAFRLLERLAPTPRYTTSPPASGCAAWVITIYPASLPKRPAKVCGLAERAGMSGIPASARSKEMKR
jgi:Fe-S-cluster-containing dehydrogenase component